MIDDRPFFTTGTHRDGPWLVTCDHARNHVPSSVNGGDLGLPAADMDRHIAYDIGAEGVSIALGELLNAPVLCSNFSRLVIDPNRGEDDPTLLMKLYDGTIIPANRNADWAERELRLDAFHRPYHAAYADLASKTQAIVAMHSFTPQLNGRPTRPWQVGVLFAGDTRLSDPVIKRLQDEGDLTIGVNEPYVGHLPGDSIDQHALRHGRLNVLIELRNDLIETPDQQALWAHRLAPILTMALNDVKDT